MQATTMGGTEHCWLSMIHSSVTPNCWLATQLDMDRLVVETAWDSLDTVISKHEGGDTNHGQGQHVHMTTQSHQKSEQHS